MKFAQIECPNCGSKIKNELMSSRITCPYCHTEVYIDDDAGAFDRKLHSVANAFDRINKSTNDTKSENKKLELEKIKVENSERRKDIKFMGLAFILLMIMLYGFGQSDKNKIGIPFSSSTIKKNMTTTKKLLNS